MRVIKTDDFEKHLKRLPSATKRSFINQLERFTSNPRHPSLQTKKLKDLEGVYSFRIGRSHRALFFFEDTKTIVLFAIGHRKDIYR
jgi:mRNA-degrading endonuclease RelE of RelBE toxin-antitoxin system